MTRMRLGRWIDATRPRRRNHGIMMLALAVIAAGACTGPVLARDGADDGIRIVAAGVNGLPRLVAPDGGGVILEQDMEIPFGYVVQTGVDSRAAIAIKVDPKLTAKGADLVQIAHNSQVEVRRPDAAAVEAGAPPVLVELLEGGLRAKVRNPDGASAFAVQAGERRVHLDGADIVMVYSPDRDTTSHIVFAGSARIHAGKRRIRVASGMSRLIEKGKILGATAISDSQRRIATNMTDIAGVVVTMDGGDDRETEGGTDAASGGAGKTPTPTPTPTTAPAADAAPVYVRMTTSGGDIVLELDAAKAPSSVANFLEYVESGYYTGTIFHRVISTFMIQGGGFDTEFTRKPTRDPIVNEWKNGLKNARGTIAMARLGGRPDSATSQFFINVVDNATLDQPQRDGAAYAVFGRVVAGMDVVDALKMVQVQASRLNPRERSEPVEPPLIRSAEVITRAEAGLGG